MVNVLRELRRLYRAAILALALALSIQVASVSPAGAAYSNPRILPPGSHAFGRTYGAWSAAWWQYVEAQPVATNPLLDTTGALCNLGQSGPVFFLVGAETTGSFTRNSCVVPNGKALFFPLENAFDTHVACTTSTAEICDSLDTPTLIWNDLVTNISFDVTSLFATIDGVPIRNLDPATSPYRACAGPVARCSAPAFTLTVPTDNLFASIGLPAGTYGPAVADGYYLLLPPLPPGAHMLTFGGTSVFNGQSDFQQITYNLVVSR